MVYLVNTSCPVWTIFWFIDYKYAMLTGAFYESEQGMEFIALHCGNTCLRTQCQTYMISKKEAMGNGTSSQRLKIRGNCSKGR